MIRSIFLLLLVSSFTVFWLVYRNQITLKPQTQFNTETVRVREASPTPTPTLTPVLPLQKILPSDYHVYQTFNNCGPAALSMALSFYGISVSQQQLGLELRPYQNPSGDNDDKSVTLQELGMKAQSYNLIPYHRPNGTNELIKRFIALDIPVLTRTWLNENDDIGHFRVVKGYDDTRNIFVQDDSLQGRSLEYSYQQFDVLWEKFGYEYLVLVPPEKKLMAESIIGEDTDGMRAWTKAAEQIKIRLSADPDNIYEQFNLSVALYYSGDYQGSVLAFEAVEDRLPFRTLWYQIEPIHSYMAVGNYERVFAITDKILTNHNRAFSELYLLRGEIYRQQGNYVAARDEFTKAVQYNKNMTAASEALLSLEPSM